MSNPYTEGAYACREGLPSCANPYHPGCDDEEADDGKGAERLEWFHGYFDQRTDSRLRHVFHRHNLLTMTQERRQSRDGAADMMSAGSDVQIST